MDGQVEIFLIPGAIELGNEYTGAQSRALEQSDEHENQVGGGADRRQSLLSDEIAHNQGVGGVIELLEQVPQKYGDGKRNQALPDGTLQHGGLGAG